MKKRVLVMALALIMVLGMLPMTALAINPYLPLDQYVPDGEPRHFQYDANGDGVIQPEEDRVYIYGSYDMDGYFYCSDKYHVFSCAVQDLGKPGIEWTNHGVSFACTDNYLASDGIPDGLADSAWSNSRMLFAPDCIQGKDGRFYLYFCTAIDKKEGVAVSDTPWGPFTDAKEIVFDGSAPDVKAEGTPAMEIDPAIFIDDDGTIHYYWGQFEMQYAELNDDMYTIKTSTYNPSLITGPRGDYTKPTESQAEFMFHEGSSMRKIGDTYYLIYCSTRRGGANCLAYATSDSPAGPFTYGGVICDNTSLDPQSWNEHGSVVEVNGEYYIFFHASTENSQKNRRARVEKIQVLEDGSIPEAENTSLGFETALDPYTTMLTPYACDRAGTCYFGDEGTGADRIFPMVNVTDGSYVGYKYFNFGTRNSGTEFEAVVRPRAGGILEIHGTTPRTDGGVGTTVGALLGSVKIPAGSGSEWITVSAMMDSAINNTQGIYLVFKGENARDEIADVLSFKFNKISANELPSAILGIEGKSGATVGTKAAFAVTIDDVFGANAFSLPITFDSKYFDASSIVVTPGEGFTLLGVEDGAISGTTITKRATLTYSAGDSLSTNVPVTLLNIELTAKQTTGKTSVGLDASGIQIAGPDGYGGAKYLTNIRFAQGASAVYIAVEPSYSVYDVNRDGKVNLLDISVAQQHYAASSADADWAKAQRSDVNGDGMVAIDDLILILKNITW